MSHPTQQDAIAAASEGAAEAGDKVNVFGPPDGSPAPSSRFCIEPDQVVVYHLAPACISGTWLCEECGTVAAREN